MEKNSYTIGITGHRHLPQERIPALIAEVQAFYEEKSAQYGFENIVVLSSIAEGADTVCAKLALDSGFRLVVPLPMPVDEYRKDFMETAKIEFDYLLSKADEVFVVEPTEDVPTELSRGFFYRQAGIYVVKNCDVLLAVWDGVEKDTKDGAGTWETVKLARGFGKPIH